MTIETDMRLLSLLLLLCQIFAVAGQLCLKVGAGRARSALASPGTAWRAALQPLLWCGGGLYAAGTILWVKVLTMADLSFAYPFAALSYAGGVIASQWLLRERVPPLRWAGLGLLVIGVIFVASSGPTS